MRKNTKGISYVELVIVMGILAALIGISSISFSAAWRARASKAANSVDAMLSQSKINALSGEDNYLKILYREKDTSRDVNESGYYAELYRVGSSTPYKSENIGSGRLRILFGEGKTDIEQNKAVLIKFNSKNGAVEYSGIEDISSSDTPASAPDKTQIYFIFGNQYCVNLWRATGEHNIS